MTHTPVPPLNLTHGPPGPPGWLAQILEWLRAFMAAVEALHLDIRAHRRTAEPEVWRDRIPSLLAAEASSLRMLARLAGVLLGQEEDEPSEEPPKRLLHPPRTWRDFLRRFEAVASRLAHAEARARALVQRILKAGTGAPASTAAADPSADGVLGREPSDLALAQPGPFARGPPAIAPADLCLFAW
jgi:hypothetical protein